MENHLTNFHLKETNQQDKERHRLMFNLRTKHLKIIYIILLSSVREHQ